MKRKILAALLALCLLCSGCTLPLLDGEYVYTQPHEDHNAQPENSAMRADTYWQLLEALRSMVTAGRLHGVILVSGYDQRIVYADACRAAESLRRTDPIAAYAVAEITLEQGKSSGEAALAVDITYLHDRAELLKIQKVEDTAAAAEKIRGALRACEVGIVLHVSRYTQEDFVQIVESYALEHPEYVIEQPRVSVGVYPDSGLSRVVEIGFSYQNSRDSLRQMQTAVGNMFTSAALYVSADSRDYDQLYHLYSFVMERFDYKIETSITPAYSLLLHGVGDRRAFAVVYAAMCARVQLESFVVTGTRDGEAHDWNIVCCDGVYYHVDLLDSGGFSLLTDEQMNGYVWDYDAYPACGIPMEQEPAPTDG